MTKYKKFYRFLFRPPNLLKFVYFLSQHGIFLLHDGTSSLYDDTFHDMMTHCHFIILSHNMILFIIWWYFVNIWWYFSRKLVYLTQQTNGGSKYIWSVREIFSPLNINFDREEITRDIVCFLKKVLLKHQTCS